MSRVFTAELTTVHCTHLKLKVVAHTCYVANTIAGNKRTVVWRSPALPGRSKHCFRHAAGHHILRLSLKKKMRQYLLLLSLKSLKRTRWFEQSLIALYQVQGQCSGDANIWLMPPATKGGTSCSGTQVTTIPAHRAY